jgi:signal peptidase
VNGEVESGRFSTSLVVLTTVVAVPLVVLIATVWLLGWHFAVVQTNSMAPGSPAGSLIVASPVSADEVSAGMVIEFVDRRHGNRHVTHRVIEVHRNETGDLWFVTQGDNNDAPDSEPVRPRDVRAEVRWSVPGLGRVVGLLRPPLSYAIAAAPFVLWMVGRLLGAGAGAMRGRVSTAEVVASRPEYLRCSDCPAPVAREDRYCRRCGTRLLPTVEATSAQGQVP